MLRNDKKTKQKLFKFKNIQPISVKSPSERERKRGREEVAQLLT